MRQKGGMGYLLGGGGSGDIADGESAAAESPLGRNASGEGERAGGGGREEGPRSGGGGGGRGGGGEGGSHGEGERKGHGG
jgi:hypothetical protein